MIYWVHCTCKSHSGVVLSVGVQDEFHRKYHMSVADVRLKLDNGDKFITVQGLAMADIRKYGSDHIRSEADGKPTNNLDSLPACSGC